MKKNHTKKFEIQMSYYIKPYPGTKQNSLSIIQTVVLSYVSI